ncbi:hypothetical protein [Spirosoma areae]
MAVLPVLTPDFYALTKGGRMLYRFSGSGRYETTGVKAIVGLNVTAPVPDGTILRLRWNGQTQVLTARTTPQLPTEFPAGDGSPGYADALAAYFRSYFPFRADFVVSRVNFGQLPLVILTARKPGAAYTLSAILTPGIGALPPPTPPITLGVDTAGADALLRERYGVYLELYLQKADSDSLTEDDFDLVDSAHVECDADGVADYDVGEVLHGYLSADVPDFTAQGGQLAQDSHRAYYVAYGEAWGQPLRPGTIVTDITRHAYLGGADFRHRAEAGFNLQTFLLGATPATDRALRFGSSARAVRIDEPQFLTFVNLRDDADSVSLEVMLTFDDEATVERTGIQAVVPFAVGAKVGFPVGVAILDLLSQVPEGKFLKEYSVQLRGQTGLRSRVYRFIVEYDLPTYRRYFVYLNSLGAFSSLMTYGKGSAELQRFYEQSERMLPSGYEPTAGQFLDYNISLQQQVEVASGWQQETELVQWNDFYCSPLRLQVVGPKIYAIGLTSKSIKQAKDGASQFAHAFSYAYLHRDEFYTDTDTPDGQEALPAIVAPAGTVVVSPLVITPVFDPSIPAAVRELTNADIQGFKMAAARPNPETLGFLTQTSASSLFRRKDQPVNYSEIANTPTTRDGAGLLDVPTRRDLFSLIKIKPHLSSWTGTDIPAEPL